MIGSTRLPSLFANFFGGGDFDLCLAFSSVTPAARTLGCKPTVLLMTNTARFE